MTPATSRHRSRSLARRRVLITGFAPFPSQPVNATQMLAPAIAAAARHAFPDIVMSAAILPTEWKRGLWTMEDLLLTETPDIVVAFGIATRAKGFEIETRAVNECNDAADAAGCKADHTTLVESAPTYLSAAWPVSDILRRLRARAIPAIPSRNAGRYLCNAVLFQTLDTARHLPRLSTVGFVHLPAELPVPGRRQTAVQRSSPLTWRQAVTGGTEIVAACLGRALPRSFDLERQPPEMRGVRAASWSSRLVT